MQTLQKYREFFLSTKSNIVQLETIELSHPSFSKSYFLVRNAVAGVVVNLENGNAQFFEYSPLKITPTANREDLDFGLNVSLGDVTQVVQRELDSIRANDTSYIKPKLIYRIYRSDVLNEVLYGPVILEISNFTFSEKGVAFEASAPKANVTGTGELYRINRFPMLKGYVY